MNIRSRLKRVGDFNPALLFVGMYFIIAGGCLFFGTESLRQNYWYLTFLGRQDTTLGLTYFGVGVVCLAIFAFKKSARETKTIICPNDGTVVLLENQPDKKCPKCGTLMEPLEGFYDRHPEFKDKE